MATFLGFTIVGLHQIKAFRAQRLQAMSVLVDAIGDSSVSALAFGDARDGNDALRGLAQFSDVEAAALYDEQGKLFATYNKRGEPPRHWPDAVVPEHLPRREIGDRETHVRKRVVHDGHDYGTIDMIASNDALRAEIASFIATLVAIAFLCLGLFAGTHGLWFTVLPLMILFGLGMSLVVSPLSTAVMTSVADRDTGTASGVNNAVARVAGLFAVATMGGLGALVFSSALGGNTGTLSFGMTAPGGLPADAVTATDHAFAAIAYVTAALSLLSGVIAWFTLEHKHPSKT